MVTRRRRCGRRDRFAALEGSDMAHEKEAAEEALIYAREALAGRKSVNKQIKDPGLWKSAEAEKRHSNAEWLSKMEVWKSNIQSVTAGPTHAKVHHLIRESGVGNCSEYALLALGYIKVHFPSTMAKTVRLTGGDHVFVAVGSLGRVLTDDIAKWSDKAYICDPWANIACKPQEYKECFRKKMQKWAREKKHVLHNGKWILPDTEDYCNMLDLPKTYMTWQGQPPSLV
jgi:hypothetical protein